MISVEIEFNLLLSKVLHNYNIDSLFIGQHHVYFIYLVVFNFSQSYFMVFCIEVLYIVIDLFLQVLCSLKVIFILTFHKADCKIINSNIVLVDSFGCFT